jgi:NADH-quinone oxidoreductase subunit G
MVVSIMPCTAKKFEAQRDELKTLGVPDVDLVLTTQELGLMIQECGIDWNRLEVGSFEMPYGFSTGAAVIFGGTGGVSEAVLRYAASKLEPGGFREFKDFRGNPGTTTLNLELGGRNISLAVVAGLRNARNLLDRIRSGELSFDLVEVMACPGGCVNGGGQPVSKSPLAIPERTKGLLDTDLMLQFHVSSENPYLRERYAGSLNPDLAHKLLHTKFSNRRRIVKEDFVIGEPGPQKDLTLEICFGTSCFLRGAQTLYRELTDYLKGNSLWERTEFRAKFCDRHCLKGPVLKINGKTFESCSLGLAVESIKKEAFSLENGARA